jgi:flagellar FliJ protein
MKRFVFRLETLRRHRANQEERERDELSRMNFLLHTEIGHRAGLQDKLRETMCELSRLRSSNADSMDADWCQRYIDRLTHEIASSDKRIAQLEKQINAQKLVVIEAIKKRKVLESLKTKQQKEFDLASERRDQKNIDEIVVTRFVRKSE